MSEIEETCRNALLFVIWKRRHFLYVIADRPDEQNRGKKDIDFVLQSAGHPGIAVEHTSIESFEGQRRVGFIHADFTKHVEQLVAVPPDTYLKLACPTEMHVQLSKRERDRLVPSVAAWVTQTVPLLKPHGRSLPLTIAGGKFTIWIGQGGSHPQLNGKLLAALMAPKNLDESREQRLERALLEKLPKLLRYDEQGMLTYLILEDWDISLSNSMIVKDVLLKLRRKHADLLPYGILQVTSYRDKIVEAWLVKEGEKWSSRIYNRGPFYEFELSPNVKATGAP